MALLACARGCRALNLTFLTASRRAPTRENTPRTHSPLSQLTPTPDLASTATQRVNRRGIIHASAARPRRSRGSSDSSVSAVTRVWRSLSSSTQLKSQISLSRRVWCLGTPLVTRARDPPASCSALEIIIKMVRRERGGLRSFGGLSLNCLTDHTDSDLSLPSCHRKTKHSCVVSEATGQRRSSQSVQYQID